MKRFINYLMEQKREDDLEKRAMRSVFEELTAIVEKLTSTNGEVSKKLGNALDELRAVRNELKAADRKAQNTKSCTTAPCRNSMYHTQR